MLFAQSPNDVTNYLTAAINLGALGIMGWYFLRVQPQCAKDRAEERMQELRLLVSMFLGKGNDLDAHANKLDVKIEQVKAATGAKPKA